MALIYACPHIWWLFGVSFGFPGSSEELETAFERTWFVVYNVFTTMLVLGSAFVAIALERDRLIAGTRRLASVLILVGAALLLLRGGLGFLSTLLSLVDIRLFDDQSTNGSGVLLAALFWEGWFVVTGMLFTLVVRRQRR
jgi:hypothetical protein